jgi:PRC-barrel domain
MLDLGTARIAYAVSSFGGFLGMGDKLFAIPWSKLMPSPSKDKTFILEVSKEMLEEKRGIDKSHWPDFSDTRFRNETYDHYVAKHYWEEKV